MCYLAVYMYIKIYIISLYSISLRSSHALVLAFLPPSPARPGRSAIGPQRRERADG